MFGARLQRIDHFHVEVGIGLGREEVLQPREGLLHQELFVSVDEVDVIEFFDGFDAFLCQFSPPAGLYLNSIIGS
jgi:hypothetical protein